MPSVILSDNGVSSGSAGLKSIASSDGALVLQTSTAGGTATNAVYIDTSQNMGLGVTPSAWRTQYSTRAIQVGPVGSIFSLSAASNNNYTGYMYNSYLDSTGTPVYLNSNYATAYYQQNGTHAWYTAPSGTAGNAITFTQAMTLDSSGNLLVGTTSTGNSNSKSFVANVASGFIVVNHLSGQGSGSGYASFGYNAGEIGSITQNGTTAVAYNTTSDYRLKENVQPLSGALARIAALKPCTYTWKSAPDEIGEGFIAHELAEVCPQAVTGEKDAVNEDGSIKPQSIDTSFLVATLTAAIQELNAKFEEYKAAHP